MCIADNAQGFELQFSYMILKVSAQKVSAQKVSGHKVSKNDYMGHKVSSEKVSPQTVSSHKVSKIDTWPKKFPPKKFPNINDGLIDFFFKSLNGFKIQIVHLIMVLDC